MYEINSNIFLFLADTYLVGGGGGHLRLDSSLYLGKYGNNPAILPGICSTQSRSKGCPQSILPPSTMEHHLTHSNASCPSRVRLVQAVMDVSHLLFSLGWTQQMKD